jgi:UBX domain
MSLLLADSNLSEPEGMEVRYLRFEMVCICADLVKPRKHVLSDLKPYVCTFEDCELKLFSDRQTWFSHELKDHRKEWNCHFCAHSPFDKAATYRAHLTTNHPNAFVEDQLPALFEMSQKPLFKISPTDCPFCDDWEDHLRAINSHISAEESLVVTPNQFEHHVGAHMAQLALFAIPRGYTEEGEADSANAAPQMDSDHSSLDDSLPDLATAEQFRKCEDILEELAELAHTGLPDTRKLQFPEFSASISYDLGRRLVRVSPVNLPLISQKLETGVYTDISDFCLDLILFFSLCRLCDNNNDRPPRDDDYYALMAFHQWWGSLAGSDCPNDFVEFEKIIFQTSRQIKWSLWRANKISPEPDANTEESCRVKIQLMNGTTVYRRFFKSADLEDVYVFVECHELIKDGSRFPPLDEPNGYIPEYSFRLRSRDVPEYRFDLQMGTIGDFMGSFADLMVVELQKGEEPQTLSQTKQRSLSPKQTPRVDGTTFMPGDTHFPTSGNDERTMLQSPGASSTSSSSAKTHDKMDPSTLVVMSPHAATEVATGMDLLSITASCVGLQNGLGRASHAVVSFKNGIGGNRFPNGLAIDALNALDDSLISLKTIMEHLVDAIKCYTSEPIPQESQSLFVQTISGCTSITVDIEETLKRHEGRKPIKFLSFTLSGVSEIKRLHSSLEFYTSSLQLVLTM